MDLLWMLLLLMVLVHSEAENVTEVRGELGRDVRLNCSFNHHDIYWYMEIHNRFKIEIGQIFDSKHPSYFSPDFETKYLMVENRLEIKNFSSDDCRLYFCGRKKDGTMVYGDTIRLVSDVSVATTSSTKVISTTTIPDLLREPVVVFSSLTLNVVLFLVGLTCVWRKSCSRRTRASESVIENLENQQYEEIHLPPTWVPQDCIYYKAQHPGSMLPRC